MCYVNCHVTVYILVIMDCYISNKLIIKGVVLLTTLKLWVYMLVNIICTYPLSAHANCKNHYLQV
jgi:hypothetical protein